jgi:hypothetical protein
MSDQHQYYGEATYGSGYGNYGMAANYAQQAGYGGYDYQGDSGYGSGYGRGGQRGRARGGRGGAQGWNMDPFSMMGGGMPYAPYMDPNSGFGPMMHQQVPRAREVNQAGEIASGVQISAVHQAAVGGFNGYRRVPTEFVTVQGTAYPPDIRERRQLTEAVIAESAWLAFPSSTESFVPVRVASRRPPAGTNPNRPKG